MQRIAFILLALGGVTILGAGLYLLLKAVFTATAVPLWFKIALGVVIGGFLLLLASVLWERRRAAWEEPFKEVKT